MGQIYLFEKPQDGLDVNDSLRTPGHITHALGPFDLDPCAGEATNIADVNWAIERGECGICRDWFGLVYCNPPFSQKKRWIKKMIQHNNGILLLPERGSAPWFGPLAEACGNYFVMGKKIDFCGGGSYSNVGTVLFLFGQVACERVANSGLPGHLVSVQWYNPR